MKYIKQMKKRVLHQKKHLNSLLIKPAGPDCNMACAYCFYREKEALFPGPNVHMEGKLIHMLNSARQNEFGRMKADLHDACKACEWLSNCRGGCTKDRLRDPRDRGLNHFCRASKMFFPHAEARMKKLAKEWKKKNARSQG